MNLITVTNVTDYPHHPDVNSLAHIVEIYNVTIMPGQTTQISVELIDEKINQLQKVGYIVVGEWPKYYTEWRHPPQKTQTQLIAEEKAKEAADNQRLLDETKAKESEPVKYSKKDK